MSTPLILSLLGLPLTLAAARAIAGAGHPRAGVAMAAATPLVCAFAFLLLTHEPTTDVPRAPASAAPSAQANVAAAPAEAAPGAAANPGEGRVDRLRAAAEAARKAKNFTEATALFREITVAAPFDADGWADLGDAEAAAAGGNLDAGAAAIDRALKLDAEHPKALWLKASVSLQHREYPAAADLWQRLLKVLPPDSSDAQIVRTNLDEARRLAQNPGKNP